jgi:hypothetical protein
MTFNLEFRGLLTGDEEHVSGWDLIYDNGFIEIDPEQCGYTTFLGAAVPQPDISSEIAGTSAAGRSV